MKCTLYSSLFTMVSQIAVAADTAFKEKNNMIMPDDMIVGIKFDIISSGKLYPGLPGLKNIHGSLDKEVTVSL